MDFSVADKGSQLFAPEPVDLYLVMERFLKPHLFFLGRLFCGFGVLTALNFGLTALFVFSSNVFSQLTLQNLEPQTERATGFFGYFNGVSCVFLAVLVDFAEEVTAVTGLRGVVNKVVLGFCLLTFVSLLFSRVVFKA